MTQKTKKGYRIHKLNRKKLIFELFVSMLKIGLFTFGGGYAMISILDNEFVERKKWLDTDEFMNLVTIAESTPGPIAINCSTYIGYKKSGFIGAVVSTLGMCIPSFTIIYLISIFFDRFLAISWIAAAFKGIQVCVVFLIFSAGLKMLKKIKKNIFNITITVLVFTTFVIFSLLAVGFSSIFYILIFGMVGLFVHSFLHARGPQTEKEERK